MHIRKRMPKNERFAIADSQALHSWRDCSRIATSRHSQEGWFFFSLNISRDNHQELLLNLKISSKLVY